jgi:hypothetical protein
MLYKRVNRRVPKPGLSPLLQGLFLLMSVLPKALLPLVRGHFVLLSFFSARHMNVLICFPLYREVKSLF